MKEDTNYWIDNNNNRWSKDSYSKNSALKKSKTLINCSNCFDCSNCYNCYNCFDCSSCSNCSNCFDCSSCSNCFECSNCFDCSNCSECSDCFDCSSCSNCSDYKNNPNRYSQKYLGFAWNNTCIYWDKEQTNITVVCGCFKGDITEFKKAVIKKYNTSHEYMKFIFIAEKIMKMELD